MFKIKHIHSSILKYKFIIKSCVGFWGFGVIRSGSGRSSQGRPKAAVSASNASAAPPMPTKVLLSAVGLASLTAIRR